MRAFVQRYPVLTFAILALGFQSLVVFWVKSQLSPGQHLHDDKFLHNVFRLRVFGPLAFAMLVTFYLEGLAGLKHLFGAFLHWRVPAKWYALGISWKFLISWVAIGFTCLFTNAVWPGFFAKEFWMNYLYNLPFIIGIAIVEETSWIRFSISRLQEHISSFWACMIVGTLWGFWYLPMLWVGEGVPAGFPISAFMATAISLTVLLAWVYNTTRSGTVLLFMQILSNTVFMMVAVLPGEIIRPDGSLEDRYIIAYSILFVVIALILRQVHGGEHLSPYKRVKWSDPASAVPERVAVHLPQPH